MMKFMTSVVMAFAVGAEAAKQNPPKKGKPGGGNSYNSEVVSSFITDTFGLCDAECEQMCRDAKELLISVYLASGHWTTPQINLSQGLLDHTYYELDGRPVDWMEYLEDERCGAGTLMI